MKGKSALSLRKIRQFDEDFTAKEFAIKAQEMFIGINETLQK